MFGIFQSHNPLIQAKRELSQSQLQLLEQRKAFEYHKAMTEMLEDRVIRLQSYVDVKRQNEFTSLPGVDK